MSAGVCEGGLVVAGEFVRVIPRAFARRHLLVGVGGGDAVERLVVAPMTSPAAIHNAAARLGRGLARELGDAEAIAAAIGGAYAEGGAPMAVLPERSTWKEAMAGEDRDLLSTGGKGPLVQLVDGLLFEALHAGASDVHVQPLADHAIVRYRIDGVLREAARMPHAVAAAVASRLKVMGRIDVAERRVPQDGRATVTIGSGEGCRGVDLRLSTMPTSYGERVVVRLLDGTRASHLLDFAALGMPEEVREGYLGRCGRSHGVVLATGPTGSGKTTTLYATLRWLSVREGARPRSQNILTIEDPIEYELATVGLAVSQTQVNARKGVTFVNGLRHILRQDPDTIMVGEIRDAETARLAIQASLTGHLVLSTLHTNDAASAVARLVDLGAEAFLVAASLSAVLAQRLVRVVHPGCGGSGCAACGGSGYRGRRGVFELITPDDAMRERIARGEPVASLRAAARAAGVRGLLDRGRELVGRGVTTEAEVRRAIEGAD